MMSPAIEAVLSEMRDRRLLNDVDDELHEEIGKAIVRAVLSSQSEDLLNVLYSHEMEKKVLYEALERALSHFAIMGTEQAARAAAEIEEVLK